MNIKYYIRGLGMGVLVTTILLTVSNHMRNKNVQAGFNDIQNQTQSVTQKETTKETKSFEVKTVQASTEKNTSSLAEKKTQEVTEAPTQKPTQMATQKPSEAKTEPPTKESKPSGGRITVSLDNVGSSESAAQAIEAAGLVDDWRDFNRYLMNNGYDRRISSSTFEFEGNEDYEAIAKIITRAR